MKHKCWSLLPRAIVSPLWGWCCCPVPIRHNDAAGNYIKHSLGKLLDHAPKSTRLRRIAMAHPNLISNYAKQLHDFLVERAGQQL